MTASDEVRFPPVSREQRDWWEGAAIGFKKWAIAYEIESMHEIVDQITTIVAAWDAAVPGVVDSSWAEVAKLCDEARLLYKGQAGPTLTRIGEIARAAAGGEAAAVCHTSAPTGGVEKNDITAGGERPSVPGDVYSTDAYVLAACAMQRSLEGRHDESRSCLKAAMEAMRGERPSVSLRETKRGNCIKCGTLRTNEACCDTCGAEPAGIRSLTPLRETIERQRAEVAEHLLAYGWRRAEAPPFARDQDFWERDGYSAIFGTSGAAREQMDREQQGSE